MCNYSIEMEYVDDKQHQGAVYLYSYCTSEAFVCLSSPGPGSITEWPERPMGSTCAQSV